MELELEMHSFFTFLSSTVTSGASIIVVAILGVIFLVGLHMLLGNKRQRGQAEDTARLAQEMYRNMENLERRLESLETLFMERDPGGKNPGDAEAGEYKGGPR